MLIECWGEIVAATIYSVGIGSGFHKYFISRVGYEAIVLICRVLIGVVWKKRRRRRGWAEIEEGRFQRGRRVSDDVVRFKKIVLAVLTFFRSCETIVLKT